MPVISSKASSGDNPFAFSQDPICLHHAFSRISGHSQIPLTMRRQTKESAWVGILSSMMTGCRYPLQKKLREYAPYLLVSCVQMICFMSEAFASFLHNRQKTQVRQHSQILSCMKLVTSISPFFMYILVFILSKSNRTDSLLFSLASILNFQSSKSCQEWSAIFLATMDLRLFLWDQLKMARRMSQSGRPLCQPQEERFLRSGSQKSLEVILGKEHDSLPIYQQYYIQHQAGRKRRVKGWLNSKEEGKTMVWPKSSQQFKYQKWHIINLARVLSSIEIPQKSYPLKSQPTLPKIYIQIISMNFRVVLLLLCVLLPCLCLIDQTKIIYYDSLVGPFNSSLPTYGNFAFNNSYYNNHIRQKIDTQNLINNLFNHYNRSQFPRGPQYYLEYYRDSSLSNVAYVVHKKVNVTHTYRYYALRALNGIRNGSVFYLGQDVCQACRPGHEMPLLSYEMMDPLANRALTMNLLNVLNTAQRSNHPINSIIQLKRWNFPQGSFYIPIITLSNSSQLYTAILDTSSNTIFLSQILVPHIMGNAEIDYVYIHHYFNCITMGEYSKVQYFRTNIHFFEFYLDTTYRDTLTFMIHIQTATKFITKVMGILQKNLGSITRGLSGAPYWMTIVYSMNYSSFSSVPYYNTSYFNNDQYDERMGTNATTTAEYNSILKFLAGIQQTNTPAPASNILNLSYIDYPNGKRQYTIDYLCTTDKKTYHIYWIPSGPVQNFRVVIGNSTFNDNTNWKAAAERVYDYAYEYELITSNAQFTYVPFNYQFVEYCGLGDNRFELMIFSSQAVSSFYSPSSICLHRQFFLKDIQTDRIVFLGNGSATSGNCTFIGSNPRPKQFCPSITGQTIDMGEVQAIYNSLATKLVNSNGDLFTVNDITSSIAVNTKVFGVPNVYALYFIKSGVLSVFYIVMTTGGQYNVIDYVEGINGAANAPSPNITLPAIGSSGPQGNISNATLNTSSTGGNTTLNTSSAGGNRTLNSTSIPSPTTTPNPVLKPVSVSTTTQNNTQIPPLPVIVANNNPNNFTALNNSKLPISYIQSDYPSLYSSFKSYLPVPAIPSKPTILAQADDEMKVVLYAVAFSYISSLYQIFEVIKLVDSNEFIYVNSRYLPELPQDYWQTRNVDIFDALQQQLDKVLRSNAACANTSLVNYTIRSTDLHCGGYYTINATLSNGYAVRVGFIQLKLEWKTVFSVFIPSITAPAPVPISAPVSKPPTFITSPPPSVPKATTTAQPGGSIPLNTPYSFNSGVSISIDTIMADRNINISFQQIYPYIFKAINGYTLKQGLKGTFTDFVAYQLIYTSCASSNITVKFVLNIRTQQVIYCAIDSATGSNVVITPSNNGSPVPVSLSQQDIAELIVRSSVNLHPELTNFRHVNFNASVTSTLQIFTVRYTTSDGSIYNQVVHVTVPSITINEISYSKAVL